MIQQEINKFMSNINPNFLIMVNMLDSICNHFYFALNAFESIHNCSWIIDLGSSYHICINLDMFDSLYNLKILSSLVLPNGSILKVEKVGVVSLQLNLILRDILYIPKFKFNLISIHKLA